MLTRKDCEELVNSPGKFEGEPVYTPYFYELYMGGEDHIHITAEDITIFPELKGYKTIILREDNEGFAYSILS